MTKTTNKIMFITIGTGSTVGDGIACSIKQQNPDGVVFIATSESREKTVRPLLGRQDIASRYRETVVLEDENDVEEIRLACKKKIKDFLAQKGQPENIVIDFTSGTKAMSAGIVLAGIEERVGSMVYVQGKRNSDGRVISGTERPVTIVPNQIHADLLFDKAVENFNDCRFEECARLATESSRLLNDPDVRSKAELLILLAEGYSSWDKFDHKEAFHVFCKIPESPLLSLWRVKSRLNDHRSILVKIKDNNFCLERVGDLLANAKRRLREGKYDDAVARLYRCLEYIAQMRLQEKGIDTGDVKKERLPESLRPDYMRYRDQKDGKIKIGLLKAYTLLSRLGDPLGAKILNTFGGKLRKLMAVRNASILAHGFVPIKKDSSEKLLQTVEEIFRLLDPDFNQRLEKLRFPVISL